MFNLGFHIRVLKSARLKEAGRPSSGTINKKSDLLGLVVRNSIRQVGDCGKLGKDKGATQSQINS